MQHRPRSPAQPASPSLPPHYRLPWRIVLGLGLDLFRGVPRPLAADSRAMVARMQPPPRVLGLRHIPPTGPLVLIANHYEGPGLWIGWSAALLTHAVSRARRGPAGDGAPLHWLVLGELDRGRVRGWKKLVLGTGWAFGRVARVWGLAALPRPEAPPVRRAAALRRLVRLALPRHAGGAGEPVGFFPEGEGDGFAGLRPVPAAAGGLIALLARRGVPAVPAAVWLDGERLTARFGAPWTTRLEGAAAADEAMARIGLLLPEAMWGAYRESIQRLHAVGVGQLSDTEGEPVRTPDHPRLPAAGEDVP